MVANKSPFLKIAWASSLLQVFGGLCKWSSIQVDSRDISGGAWGKKKSMSFYCKNLELNF